MRLVVFDRRDHIAEYVSARAPCEYNSDTGELHFGEDTDILAVITDMAAARHVGAGCEFTHVRYMYLAPGDVIEYLSTKIRG